MLIRGQQQLLPAPSPPLPLSFPCWLWSEGRAEGGEGGQATLFSAGEFSWHRRHLPSLGPQRGIEGILAASAFCSNSSLLFERAGERC